MNFVNEPDGNLSETDDVIAEEAQAESGDVLSNTVYNTLKSQLMQAQLLPLQRLKVRDLARSLGTSETPVREALIQLSREGAIEIKPRYYIRVRKLSDEYEEIRAMRLELEPMAAERALPHITEDDIIQLEDLHRRLIAAEQSGDWPEALQTNFDFHFIIYRRSGMKHLIDVLEALWMRIGPILSELYPHAMPTYAGQHQHEVVLAALRDRDSYALRMAIRMDLLEGGAALIRHLKSSAYTD
ncbi:GntR family transcriptional regulator [Brucella rhizosphaerae]|uniref:GntR family transcriptional regulator n=1 Tax=Brucella rhizosphaerae TaxID=571254 RepID=UPI00361F945E